MSSTHFIESYQIPVSIGDLEELQNMLRTKGVLLSIGEEDERYQAITYRRQKAHHNTDTCALLDRNTLSDVLSIVRPVIESRSGLCEERGRTGAAMMAFLQCANALIEPNIALYENSPSAIHELQLFRTADNVGASFYAHLALGKIDRLPPHCIPTPPKTTPAIDFSTSLKNAQKFRIALLKIAALDLNSGSNDEKLRDYLHWSFDEFCMLLVPTLTAITHFSPRRRSSILKQVRARDRQKALESVENAIWDMQVIQHWGTKVRKQREENRIWLLCSRDEALRRVAEILFATRSSPDDALRTITKEWWGDDLGHDLAELMISLEGDSRNPRRRCNQPLQNGYLHSLESELRNRVTSWQAKAAKDS